MAVHHIVTLDCGHERWAPFGWDGVTPLPCITICRRTGPRAVLATRPPWRAAVSA